MGNTNYFSGIVKILENPVQSLVNEKTLKVSLRAELSQLRQNKIILLVFWGNLSSEIQNYYQINDYILIEGYTSIQQKNSKFLTKTSENYIITVSRVYPFLLNSNKLIRKK